jgi:membrane protease YdiL (CAAX protease family)
MKPYVKAIIFLILLIILDFLFRKGFFAFIIPVPVLPNIIMFFLFLLFAICSWLVTRWFCRSDNIGLNDIGVSWSKANRFEFFIGFIVGAGLWALVSLVQAFTADFSWNLRADPTLFNLLYGLIFIFIADLGTELFYRGYPLTKFKDSFGYTMAIVIMVLFVGLKSFSFEVEGELLLYSMIIPALHTLFFSIIYFKTKRIGACLGIHTGANFITISVFDLRIEQPHQAIPAGIFEPSIDVNSLSLTALQLPWIIVATVLSAAVYYWWRY